MNREAIQELESKLAEIQDAVSELATPANEERVGLLVESLGELRNGLRLELERGQ